MSDFDTTLSQYYANLLILQYKGKPKAYATVQATVNPVIMDQLPKQVENAYSVGAAVGVQLDVLGKYIGISRSGSSFSGPITLDDTDYRSLLQIMIARNFLASDQESIQNFIHTYFNGVLQEFDNLSMHMSYFYLVPVGTNLVAEFFIKAGQLPKPMGVALAEIIYAVPTDTFFGFRTTKAPAQSATAFNVASNYQGLGPWLSVRNGFVI